MKPLVIAGLILGMLSGVAVANPLNSIARTVSVAANACPDEKISLGIKRITLPAPFEGAIIRLTSSKGICFGQVGENNYFVARRTGDIWRILLNAEPGIIMASTLTGTWPRLVVQNVGQCKVTYDWTGNTYRASSSRGCRGLMHGPNLQELARIIRGQ